MSRATANLFAMSLTVFGTVAAAHAGGSFTSFADGVVPSGVNADGSVLAGTSAAAGEYFYWTAEAGVVLVGGVTPGDGVGGDAKVSDDGNFFSGSLLNTKTGLTEMGRFDMTAGEWTMLGTVGGSCDAEASGGWGISGDGSTVVGLGWVGPCTAEATQWVDGVGIMSLGTTNPGNATRANCANFDGSVVGGWQDGAGRQGAIWVNGVQTLLFNDAEETQPLGEVAGVSDDGAYAVGIGMGVTGFLAYRWSEEGVDTLGPWMENPTWRGGSTATSGDGSTVVGFYRPFPPFPGAGSGFIWTEDGGLQNLTTFVQDQGIDTEGLVLSLPLAVSKDGMTIVGLARPEVGFGQIGFRVTIGGEVVPGDLDNDGDVDGNDLLILLNAWGPCPNTAGGECPADLDVSGAVSGNDLLILLNNWG